jgi:Cu/Ag efflux protein CusF
LSIAREFLYARERLRELNSPVRIVALGEGESMREHGGTLAWRRILNLTSCALAAGVAVTSGLVGCGASKQTEQPQQSQPAQQQSGPKRYQLEGRVVALDPANNQVVVDHKDIPGFMMGMTMPYPVKDPNQLKPLAPQDQIKADVVVNGNDVYLDNIVVTKKSDQAAKAPAASNPAAPPPASK